VAARLRYRKPFQFIRTMPTATLAIKATAAQMLTTTAKAAMRPQRLFAGAF
jgi:hypothetical protein